MDLQQLAKLAFDAASSGALSWPNLAAVAALVAVVGLLRMVLAPRVPFFGTPEGGILLNVLASGFGAVVTALCGGSPFSWGLLGGALLMSWKAAGGWSLLKNVWPLLLKVPFIAALFPPKLEVVPLPAVAPVKAPTSDQIVNSK
jgi:hypothetical protein